MTSPGYTYDGKASGVHLHGRDAVSTQNALVPALDDLPRPNLQQPSIYSCRHSLPHARDVITGACRYCAMQNGCMLAYARGRQARLEGQRPPTLVAGVEHCVVGGEPPAVVTPAGWSSAVRVNLHKSQHSISNTWMTQATTMLGKEQTALVDSLRLEASMCAAVTVHNTVPGLQT